MEECGMRTDSGARPLTSRRGALRLYVPPGPDARAAFWRINGYRASLLIWTCDEWENLKDRPADAQYHPKGVWCWLRVD
jgi:hypothetical protein